MPATVADPNRSLDSEQISPATIAHHTVYDKTPNLHQSHICQWGAQPYLVGPLSRLVGKPPLSPWVSADVLSLTQVVNNTNSAIPLTDIFDRVFSDVCNSLGFEVQKQKKRGSGNNRVYRNLKMLIIPSVACCAQYSAVFEPAVPNDGVLPQPSVVHFLFLTMTMPSGACCVQYSADFVPEAPNDGSLPQPSVVHLLFLTLTIPSGACCAQYFAVCVPSTPNSCLLRLSVLHVLLALIIRQVRVMHSNTPLLCQPLRTTVAYCSLWFCTLS